MKILKYIAVWVSSMALLVSCNEGIDPINPVSPGSDTEAPTATISKPLPGGLITVEEGAAVAVDLVAEDEIQQPTGVQYHLPRPGQLLLLLPPRP